MTEFILASGSPRRRDILLELGANFRVITAEVDENLSADLPPELLVQELALLKGAAVAKNHTDIPVISASCS